MSSSPSDSFSSLHPSLLLLHDSSIRCATTIPVSTEPCAAVHCSPCAKGSTSIYPTRLTADKFLRESARVAQLEPRAPKFSRRCNRQTQHRDLRYESSCFCDFTGCNSHLSSGLSNQSLQLGGLQTCPNSHPHSSAPPRSKRLPSLQRFPQTSSDTHGTDREPSPRDVELLAATCTIPLSL